MIPKTFEEFKENIRLHADIMRRHGLLGNKESFNLYKPKKSKGDKPQRRGSKSYLW